MKKEPRTPDFEFEEHEYQASERGAGQSQSSLVTAVLWTCLGMWAILVLFGWMVSEKRLNPTVQIPAMLCGFVFVYAVDRVLSGMSSK